MKQVFFITDDRMTALLWQGNRIIAKYEFRQDETSQAELEKYLHESRDIESQIIVDLLEEEVTLTTIPHVNPRERKFLIDRVRTRLHRGTQFSFASITGRATNQRRDDNLMVSGLTSDRILLKWLEVFIKCEVRLKGIYSLPLISGNILKIIGKKSGITLLVSRQSKNFIRQSIFNNGKLIYSRNIPSQQQLNLDTFSADLEKTRKYIQNQKLIGFDERVDVVILTSERFYQQLSGLDELITDMDLQYVRHDDIAETLAIKSERPEYRISGHEIFSAILLKSVSKNHYGRDEDTKIHRKKRINDWMNYTSIGIAVIFVMMTAKLYLDTNLLNKNMRGLEEQVVSLRQQNDKMNKVLSALPLKAKQMKTFVDNMEAIERLQKKGLEQALVQLSRVIESYGMIRLQKIKWHLSASDAGKAKSKKRKKKRNKKNRGKKTTKPQGQLIELTASINVGDIGNEKALKVVERFIKSLSGLKRVQQVKLIKSPVKDSSNERVAGVMSDKMRSKEAEFSLSVNLGGADHAG